MRLFSLAASPVTLFPVKPHTPAVLHTQALQFGQTDDTYYRRNKLADPGRIQALVRETARFQPQEPPIITETKTLIQQTFNRDFKDIEKWARLLLQFLPARPLVNQEIQLGALTQSLLRHSQTMHETSPIQAYQKAHSQGSLTQQLKSLIILAQKGDLAHQLHTQEQLLLEEFEGNIGAPEFHQTSDALYSAHMTQLTRLIITAAKDPELQDCIPFLEEGIHAFIPSQPTTVNPLSTKAMQNLLKASLQHPGYQPGESIRNAYARRCGYMTGYKQQAPTMETLVALGLFQTEPPTQKPTIKTLVQQYLTQAQKGALSDNLRAILVNTLYNDLRDSAHAEEKNRFSTQLPRVVEAAGRTPRSPQALIQLICNLGEYAQQAHLVPNPKEVTLEQSIQALKWIDDSRELQLGKIRHRARLVLAKLGLLSNRDVPRRNDPLPTVEAMDAQLEESYQQMGRLVLSAARTGKMSGTVTQLEIHFSNSLPETLAPFPQTRQALLRLLEIGQTVGYHPSPQLQSRLYSLLSV